MDTMIDLKAQTAGEFAKPLDNLNEARKQAQRFAFAEDAGASSWKQADGAIKHTPLLLGEGFPIIMVSTLRRRLYDDKGKRVGLSETPEFDYHVGSTGYGDDLDKALLHAIGARNGMDVNDIWRFTYFVTAMLRYHTRGEALREVKRGIEVGVERGIEDSIDWNHYLGVINTALHDEGVE